MKTQELLTIFKTTANRIFKRQYRYFITNRDRISESEARHVMTKVLEEFRYYYGIELKTEKPRGLVDLVIFDNKREQKRLGWVEFKREVVTVPKIQKDFEKMMKENNLAFVSFYHILPKKRKKDKNVAEAVLERYEDAHENAIKKLESSNVPISPKEFILFFLDCEKGQYSISRFNDIRKGLDFSDIKWKKISY